MQEHEQEPKEAWPSTNIFGWKWSRVSLVIIVVSLLFLVIVGPRNPGGNAEGPAPGDTEISDTTELGSGHETP